MATTHDNDEPRRPMRVVLAKPRGFCAGVERAIQIVERAIEHYGAPIYVRHEIVHNRRVVNSLTAKGARFVEEIDEIPKGAVTVFSAHGVSKKVEGEAIARDLTVIDATCPLVTKVHKEGRRYAEKGYEIILIGHQNHPEVEGTMGQVQGRVHLVTCLEDANRVAPTDGAELAYVTQTTLSIDDTRGIIDALKTRFPNISGPDLRNICYATQNRQSAVRTLTKEVDVILVVGAKNSSNSNRLREIGEASGRAAYLIDDATNLELSWFDNVSAIGITSGASAPEDLVMELLERLREVYDTHIEELDGIEEHVRFRLPEKLAKHAEAETLTVD